MLGVCYYTTPIATDLSTTLAVLAVSLIITFFYMSGEISFNCLFLSLFFFGLPVADIDVVGPTGTAGIEGGAFLNGCQHVLLDPTLHATAAHP